MSDPRYPSGYPTGRIELRPLLSNTGPLADGRPIADRWVGADPAVVVCSGVPVDCGLCPAKEHCPNCALCDTKATVFGIVAVGSGLGGMVFTNWRHMCW